MESTTTSLQAVPREPTTVASSAPAGERTTVPMAAQDADPAWGDHRHLTPSSLISVLYNQLFARCGQHLLKTGNSFIPGVCMVALGRHLHVWLQG